MSDEKEELEESEEEYEEEEVDWNEVNRLLELVLGKSKEEAIAKAVESLTTANRKRILQLSDVSDAEIPKISSLKVTAYRYDMIWLDLYLFFNLLLRVSRNRLGRKEIVSIAGSKTTFFERFRRFFKPKGEEQDLYVIP